MALAVGVCSCSSDEPQTPEEKAALLTRIANGEVNSWFEITDVELHELSPKTGWNWEKQELKGLFGYKPSLPSRLILKDGRTWMQCQLSSPESGLSSLSLPWSVYCKVTGTPEAIFYSEPITLSEDKTYVRLYWNTCEILNSSDQEFTVSCVSSFYTFGFGKGLFKDVITYKRIDDKLIDFDKHLWYNSESELIVDIIARLRAQFGDVFNLNDYIYPEVLDDPIVDLNALAKELLTK